MDSTQDDSRTLAYRSGDGGDPERIYPFSDSVNLSLSLPKYSEYKPDVQLYSEVCSAGGYLWRLLAFPQGNRSMDVLSAYLVYVGPDESAEGANIGRPRPRRTSLEVFREDEDQRQQSCERQNSRCVGGPVAPESDVDSHVTRATADGSEDDPSLPKGDVCQPQGPMISESLTPADAHSFPSSAENDGAVEVEAALSMAQEAVSPPSRAPGSTGNASGDEADEDGLHEPNDEDVVSENSFDGDDSSSRPAPLHLPRTVNPKFSSVVEVQVWFWVKVPAATSKNAKEEDDSAVDYVFTMPPGGEGVFGANAVVFKNCRQRFTTPGDDWGFRELLSSKRAKSLADSDGTVSLKAHVVVYSHIYTGVREDISQLCSSPTIDWKELVDLVQMHGSLAADAPTCTGLSHVDDTAPLLHVACKHGKKKYAALLRARGADLDAEDDACRSAMFYAVVGGSLDVVKWLAEENSFTVHNRDNEGRNPLFYACEEGLMDVVRYFVEEHGADAIRPDDDGETPLRIAETRGHFEVAEYLHDLLEARNQNADA